MPAQPTYVALGHIIGVHGVHGWVKIHSDCRPREGIFDYPVFYLHKRQSSSPTQTLTLLEGRAQGKGLIAHFDGIDDRDSAIALKGLTVSVLRSELPELSSGEYYWTDLFGLTVVNREGLTLGVVSDIFATGANDVLEVKSARQTHLIPLISEHYVERVDLDARRVYVDWQAEWSAVDKADLENDNAD